MSTHTSWAYVNGHYGPTKDAHISVLDRGFLFADGVYEVTTVLKGQLIDYGPHVARLQRSMDALGLRLPVSTDELEAIHRQLIDKSGLEEGMIYLQVTRGAEETRNFPFPQAAEPSLVMFTQTANISANPLAETGARLASMPDLRWARRDIKSVALLAQVLAKQEAKQRGAYEAVMTEDGFVTEGGSSSVGMINADGVIVLRPFSQAILPSITRQAVTKLAELHQLRIEERLFTLEELKAAREVFLAAASALVMPVVQIDDTLIGDGKPGAQVRRLRALYFEAAEQQIRDQTEVLS